MGYFNYKRIKDTKLLFIKQLQAHSCSVYKDESYDLPDKTLAVKQYKNFIQLI